MGHALQPDFDPEGLKLPHIQQAFARVLAVGASELTMQEINWDQVIAKWNLPVKGAFSRPVFDPPPKADYPD